MENFWDGFYQGYMIASMTIVMVLVIWNVNK